MKILMAMSSLALISGLAMGDTISENGGSATFTNVPNLTTNAQLNSGIPYWDNHSGDFGGTNTANAGFFLTAAGSFSGGTNYSPNQYVAASSGNPDAPTAFNLVHSTNSLLISLIGANTGGTTETFGIYDASKSTFATAAATEIALFGPGSMSAQVGTLRNESAAGFASVGFYLSNSSVGATWFSNTALNANGTSGDAAGHQHYALFTTGTDANTFYLAVEDWITGAGDGLGDYNDLVIKINADAVPEPATFALMGAGLLGLGFARFRTRKNRK
jgi:hypothetical protein